MTADWPYPAPHDDGRARHLVPGLALPGVELPSTEGVMVDPSRIGGCAVLFVYPWTGSPGVANPPGWDDIPGAHGSTPEALGFRDLHAQFAALGISIYGVSGQTSAEQRAFATRAELTYPLLSDAGGRFRDALDLPAFETGGVRYFTRLTLVAEDGKIARVFYPVHPPDRHAAQVFAALTSQE